MDFKKIILAIIRILLGCTFISSAVLKLFSLDSFVLYVYSFGIFSYVATTILARILIVIEFLLGVGLLFRIFYKFTWWSSFTILVVFSLFLTYVAIFRGNENCHCFGDFVDLSAIPSIIKNVVMLICLFLVKQQEELSHGIKPYIVTISISTILFVAFIGFPPDALFNKMYHDDNERFSQVAFNKHLADSAFNGFIDTTRNEIIGLVSASCSHCKAGNRIMQAIFERNKLPQSSFKNIIWTRNDSTTNRFKDTTNTQNFQYIPMSPIKITEINYGYFPTYIFLQKGTPIKAINYKEINEKEIVEFLQE